MTIADTVVRGPVKKDRPEPVARTVKRRSVAGKDLGTVDLEPSIFGIEPNLAVMHQVVTAQLAAIRAGRGPRCAGAGPSPSPRRAPAGPARVRAARPP